MSHFVPAFLNPEQREEFQRLVKAEGRRAANRYADLQDTKLFNVWTKGGTLAFVAPLSSVVAILKLSPEGMDRVRREADVGCVFHFNQHPHPFGFDPLTICLSTVTRDAIRVIETSAA